MIDELRVYHQCGISMIAGMVMAFALVLYFMAEGFI